MRMLVAVRTGDASVLCEITRMNICGMSVCDIPFSISDKTFYRMFLRVGVGVLCRQREFIIDSQTYGRASTNL